MFLLQSDQLQGTTMNYPSPMAQIVTINPLLHTFTVSSQRPKFVLISTTYIWVCLITANTLHQTKVAEEIVREDYIRPNSTLRHLQGEVGIMTTLNSKC